MAEKTGISYQEIVEVLSQVDQRVVGLSKENGDLRKELAKMRADFNGLLRRYGIHLNHYHQVAADDARGRVG